MNLTEEEKAQMYEELLEAIESYPRDSIPEPNITSKEYAQEKGITTNAAYRRLESAVTAGRLQKSELVLIKGNWCHVYWKA